LSSAPLAAFFTGSSLVSLLLAPKLFGSGRKPGFVAGIALSMVGTGLGIVSVVAESLILLLLSAFFFGMATGIGFFWRFAVIEVVPSSWASRAVTLVVSGGCLAAFLGPESARLTKNQWGHEYLGVFLMTGVFNALNLVCTLLVTFSEHTSQPQILNQSTESNVLRSLLLSRDFLTPMLLSSFAWIIMAVPMSLLRVAMHQVGFTQRDSLTTMEIHFLAMYAPGFVTGMIIQRMGCRWTCASAIGFFGIAMLCLLLAGEKESSSSILLWIVGMVSLGIGWNLGFTGATVWTTRVSGDHLHLKSSIQSINDSFMFFATGVCTVSASFIFKAGGGALDGWKVLSYVVIGYLALNSMIALQDFAPKSTAQDVEAAG